VVQQGCKNIARSGRKSLLTWSRHRKKGKKEKKGEGKRNEKRTKLLCSVAFGVEEGRRRREIQRLQLLDEDKLKRQAKELPGPGIFRGRKRRKFKKEKNKEVRVGKTEGR